MSRGPMTRFLPLLTLVLIAIATAPPIGGHGPERVHISISSRRIEASAEACPGPGASAEALVEMMHCTGRASGPIPRPAQSLPRARRGDVACNLPPPAMWPPDGCPDYAAIAPPATPIPPACVADARVEWWNEDGTPVTELSIYVDHPEIGPGITTYTKLARYQIPKSAIRNPKWELVDLDWEVDCGKDEGPLTWASLQVLNGNAPAGLSIYQRPLPAWYIALLIELSGRPRLYLPVVQKGSR